MSWLYNLRRYLYKTVRSTQISNRFSNTSDKSAVLKIEKYFRWREVGISISRNWDAYSYSTIQLEIQGKYSMSSLWDNPYKPSYLEQFRKGDFKLSRVIVRVIQKSSGLVELMQMKFSNQIMDCTRLHPPTNMVYILNHLASCQEVFLWYPHSLPYRCPVYWWPICCCRQLPAGCPEHVAQTQRCLRENRPSFAQSNIWYVLVTHVLNTWYMCQRFLLRSWTCSWQIFEAKSLLYDDEKFCFSQSYFNIYGLILWRKYVQILKMYIDTCSLVDHAELIFLRYESLLVSPNMSLNIKIHPRTIWFAMICAGLVQNVRLQLLIDIYFQCLIGKYVSYQDDFML